jgi:hypothetical protein
MAELSSNERALYLMLVERTRVLAIVVDNAAEVLSEDFQDMVLGPLRNVQEILKQIPIRPAWNGEFKDEDITVEYFRHDSQRFGEDAGVRIRHLPTDLGVETYQMPTREENYRQARRALASLVKRRWEEASAPP